MSIIKNKFGNEYGDVYGGSNCESHERSPNRLMRIFVLFGKECIVVYGSFYGEFLFCWIRLCFIAGT